MTFDPNARLELVEESVRCLSARLPNAPSATMMLGRVIVELGRQLSGLLEQEIRPYGLAEPEFRVLSALFSRPDGTANPSELCERTGQSPANMSRLSDVLVELGLISRELSEKDRRRMVLRITGPGEELVHRILPALFDPLKIMFGGFSEAEQLALVAQLKRVGARPGATAASGGALGAPAGAIEKGGTGGDPE